MEAEIRRLKGSDLRSAAEEAARSDADVVVAGGGDGTLSTVAGVLAGTQKPMGILPLGTLNHFAKDLGIPLDVAEAARVVAAGHVRNVDVGQVNDRVFVNNSSLGLYPLMVLDRDRRQARDGAGKWQAMSFALLRVFRLFPLVTVRLTTDEGVAVRRAPLVFVGNNRYELNLFDIGSRVCIDKGELSLYVANAHTRWGMLKLVVRAILGRLEQSRDFDSFCLSGCLIETRRRRIHVAVDGEVIELPSPLEYRTRPAGLRVCLPRTSNDTVPTRSSSEVKEKA